MTETNNLQAYVDRSLAKLELTRDLARAATELACKEMEVSVRAQLAVVVEGKGQVSVDSDTFSDAWMKYYARLILRAGQIGRGELTLEEIAAWSDAAKGGEA